jgi:hypothetical protein
VEILILLHKLGCPDLYKTADLCLCVVVYVIVSYQSVIFSIQYILVFCIISHICVVRITVGSLCYAMEACFSD